MKSAQKSSPEHGDTSSTKLGTTTSAASTKTGARAVDKASAKNVTKQAARAAKADDQKLISFALPCYNAAAYMDKCVESILAGAHDFLNHIEIILVNDGSFEDDTAAKADAWQAKHPGIIKAIHQENGGHGEAVNTGLKNATGTYFKVVDSDDWLDEKSLSRVLLTLEDLAASKLDLLISNYVYEKIHENKSKVIRYTSVLPQDRVFTWDDIKAFKPQQNLLMHAVIYRTQLLRATGLQLPKHTFYVDNIFVYVPLPAVKSIYYLDLDLYRYFIGREDQSVNEKTMIGRIEQQLFITRFMIDAFHLNKDVSNVKLRKYMTHYLTMMMTICSVFLRLSDRADAEEQRRAIWAYLKENDPEIYPKIRGGALGLFANLPGGAGKVLSTSGYKLARKLFAFN